MQALHNIDLTAMSYNRHAKHQQRRRRPLGGHTLRDPADEPATLPKLRMRITAERFDFGAESHVMELHRTKRVDVYNVTIDGVPQEQSGLSVALANLRKALPRVMSPRRCK